MTLKTRKSRFTSAIASLMFAASVQAAEPKNGGDIIVTYQNDVATLDPAIGYDWQNWSMIKSLFDGLMDYVPGTTELRLDLAESYTLSEDEKTYTFKLRPGVKFHNGREMKATDVKYSLERTSNPNTKSPGAGFFSPIVGYDAVSRGETTELEGVKVLDDYTVSIELTAPNATFLHVMGLNFASIVPKEEVEKYGEDFGKNPVGTGAYELANWTLGQKLVFEKNPEYFRPGVPYIDTITFEVGQEPLVALQRLERDEVDVAGDGIPPAKYLQFKNDPRFQDLMVTGNQLHTGYLTLNVTMPPLDDLKVRQAINMAINKDRIVRICVFRRT